jgi:hypothetical protein
MSDEQKPCLDIEDPSPANDPDVAGKEGASPRSYYYDDATGYEAYQDDTDEDSAEPEAEVSAD